RDDRALYHQRYGRRAAEVALAVPGADEDVVGAEGQNYPGGQGRAVVSIDVDAVHVHHEPGDRVAGAVYRGGGEERGGGGHRARRGRDYGDGRGLCGCHRGQRQEKEELEDGDRERFAAEFHVENPQTWREKNRCCWITSDPWKAQDRRCKRAFL